MSLLSRKDLPGGALCVYRIVEPEEWYLNRLQFDATERAELSAIKGFRRLEWLACRYGTHEMLSELQLNAPGGRLPVRKDEYGKPFIEDCPFQLSYSHSHGRVAVMLALPLCGVDIQRFVAKISRIAHKFLAPEEAESLDPAQLLRHLHLYWSAKEAVYKAFGRKSLEFNRQIRITPFGCLPSVNTEAVVNAGRSTHYYEVQIEQEGDFFLAWCVETTHVR